MSWAKESFRSNQYKKHTKMIVSLNAANHMKFIVEMRNRGWGGYKGETGWKLRTPRSKERPF